MDEADTWYEKHADAKADRYIKTQSRTSMQLQI